MCKCKRCGYETNMKYMLKRHLQRKNPCNPSLEDIARDILIQELDEETTDKSHKCKHCNKMFTAASNMYRHQKICNANSNEIDLLKETVSNLQKQLTDMQNNPQKPSIYNHNNTTNNNTTNIDNMNNIIVLNNFGNESYEHITSEFLKTCVLGSMTGVKSLIEKIHFSDEAPMNKNVRMKSMKNNLVEVADNHKWVVKDANEAMETMINKGCRLLNGFYHNPETGMMEYDINELDTMIQTFLLTVMDKNNKNYFAVRRRILALIIENTDGM